MAVHRNCHKCRIASLLGHVFTLTLYRLTDLLSMGVYDISMVLSVG